MQARVKLSKAAEILGISYRTAKRKVASSEIPTVVSATGRRYVLSEWLEQQTHLVATVQQKTPEQSNAAVPEKVKASIRETIALLTTLLDQ